MKNQEAAINLTKSPEQYQTFSSNQISTSNIPEHEGIANFGKFIPIARKIKSPEIQTTLVTQIFFKK